MRKLNFGCGLSISTGWVNYDASPTLRIQRLPGFGRVAKRLLTPRFPSDVIYGDVSRSLPETSSSVFMVYCSHVLEHLSLEDFRLALREVNRVLIPGGTFRGVLPDLEYETRTYLDNNNPNACSGYMERTSLGVKHRPKGLVSRLRTYFGNSAHLWMWDYKGLREELQHAGFCEIRRAVFNDSKHSEFKEVEQEGRWLNCLGFECIRRREGA